MIVPAHYIHRTITIRKHYTLTMLRHYVRALQPWSGLIGLNSHSMCLTYLALSPNIHLLVFTTAVFVGLRQCPG